MSGNRNRQQRRELIKAILKGGGYRYEVEYILGTFRPPNTLISDKVRQAKIIWDNGGTVDDVLKALAS